VLTWRRAARVVLLLVALLVVVTVLVAIYLFAGGFALMVRNILSAPRP